MDIIYVACFICILNIVSCHSDSESAESNRIEVTPFYDTIIYSDIADIINDIENNGVSAFDVLTNSESQSDEKLEDLLNEYQHYLEKAHKQKKRVENLKSKNKVPLLRHDKFSKLKPVDYKRSDYYYSNGFYNPGAFKFSQGSFNNPLDVFIPINTKGKYMNIFDVTTTSIPKGMRENLFPFDKTILSDKKILELPPVIRKSSYEPIKSQCYCKNGQVPCECNCKQCIIQMEPLSRDGPIKMLSPETQTLPRLYSSLQDTPMKIHEGFYGDNKKEIDDNILNIRIKLDLQLPRLLERFGTNQPAIRNRTYEADDIISKELTTSIKLPFPYLNFPIPIPFGFNKPSKYIKDDITPLHKITIHKRKKSKPNNNNKKHRKKIITFHNIKVEHQSLFPISFDDNITDAYKNKNSNVTTEATIKSNFTSQDLNSILNKTDDILSAGDIHVIINTSNITHFTTGDYRKFENTIGTDLPKIFSSVTTNLPMTRMKREVNKGGNDKKSDKSLLTDSELLYWPSVVSNATSIMKKNITSIILENEHKKSKLNMSIETMRHNHTRVLEQAIFGNVDWDDVDTVAPAFMSFVGKYIRGILTFCSQQVCHSMKCANKACLHRVCVPADRLNNKGHCAGSNSTDSIASMESIMDLPSNIAFEIVDILQNKMLGKIFGKATFCINSKCITLVASKKIFIKSRCTIKELNTEGHCSNEKTIKTVL